MIKTRFVDDYTIEVITPGGEKFTWKTYFATPKQHQKYYAKKLAYYYQKFFKDNIGYNTGMSIGILGFG
jgi:hypothetical protein